MQAAVLHLHIGQGFEHVLAARDLVVQIHGAARTVVLDERVDVRGVHLRAPLAQLALQGFAAYHGELLLLIAQGLLDPVLGLGGLHEGEPVLLGLLFLAGDHFDLVAAL